MALVLQQGAQERTHVRFILDQQDTELAASEKLSAWASRRIMIWRCPIAPGEQDRKATALGWPALRAQFTTMGSDNTLAHRQPEPGSSNMTATERALARHKGVKNSAEYLFWNTKPGIADL